MFEGVEAALDDVAPLVGVLVVGDGPSAGGAFAFPVGLLVVLFGDDAFDATPAKVACEQAVVDGFGSTRTRMTT